MKKISTKALWISVAIAFVLAIVLIVLCSYANDKWNKVIIVLLAIDFIYLTLAIQAASFKTFKYKAKKIVYDQKDYTGKYDNIYNLLKSKGYKQRKANYGYSFLKIEGATAYKCVLVDDYNAYFNQPESGEYNKPNKDLEKCKVFVGVELFKEIDETNLEKLTDFSFQGNRIYYTCLLYQENDSFKCLNYVEATSEFKQAFDQLLDDIDIKEVNVDLKAQ